MERRQRQRARSTARDTSGTYLTATSTFYEGSDNARPRQYGIFAKNWSGGTWDNMYASNFTDSGFYIGACMQLCNQTINHAHAQFNAVGYSGSNSGGTLVVKNSEFDQNTDGFDTNSQNTTTRRRRTAPARTTESARSPTRTRAGCSMNNYVHDNNNPNSPDGRLGRVGAGWRRDVDLRRPQRHGDEQPDRPQQRLGDAAPAIPGLRGAVHRRSPQLPAAGQGQLCVGLVRQRDRGQSLREQRGLPPPNQRGHRRH